MVAVGIVVTVGVDDAMVAVGMEVTVLTEVVGCVKLLRSDKLPSTDVNDDVEVLPLLSLSASLVLVIKNFLLSDHSTQNSTFHKPML